MNPINELIATYSFSSEKKNPDADFFALLSFVKCQGIKHHFLTFDLNVNPAGYFEQIGKIKGSNKVVYLHIDDITYLDKLKTLLSGLKDQGCLIVVGGHTSITFESSQLLEVFNEIDAILRKPEEEKALVNLIKAILAGKNWKSVKGITYRKGDENKIVINKNRTLSKNINHISSLGIHEHQIPNNDWYPIIISRGCFYNCRYCLSQLQYYMDSNGKSNYWRKKSGKKVVDEIELLMSKGIDKFQFYCDQFFESKPDQNASTADIAGEIIRRNLKLSFKFFSKPRELRNNFEIIPVLHEAGLKEIGIGIDSGVQRFHELYQTGSTIEDIIEVLKFIHEHRLKFYSSFILFEPYLTIEEIKETIVFLETIAAYFSHLEQPYSAYLDSRVLRSVLILRCGMPILQELKRDGLLIEYPGFSKHPAATFLDPQVKNVYSIYRSVNQTLLPKIRHFFYDKELVKRYGFIYLFPLRILEKISMSVVEKKFTNLEDYVLDIETYIKQTFITCIDNIFSDFPAYRNEKLEQWVKNI